MTAQTLGDKEAEFLHDFASMIEEISGADIEKLREAIATAAYYKAERRGFEPGHELPDWLDAEEEVRSMMATEHPWKAERHGAEA